MPQKFGKPTHYISLAEASRLCPYSQEYLSLLARRDKLFAKKIGRNWFTTKEALSEYLKNQSDVSVQNGKAVLASAKIFPTQNTVFEKLDKISESLEKFAKKVSEKTGGSKPSRQTRLAVPPPRSRSSARIAGIMISAIVILYLLAGGFSFGQVDYMARQVKQFFKDTDTIQGHFAGTHANEVLVLDQAGNVSIFGHIETQGQLRSFAPEGVAPITVDSMTLVENLNAEYLDSLASKDFTLAFVTKNGNITYEDVFLEGKVEVGKTLIVKGAAKLLDSLNVYGKLGVFADAVFSKNVQLTGGNLKLQEGTIEINNRSMVKNLNSEFFQDKAPGDFTLDFVVSNGDETNKIAFFNGGLYGGNGAFSSLGVAGDVSVGNQDDKDNTVAIFSKKFTLDDKGNVTASGRASASDLAVSGNVYSNLIASGSFDLGSSAKRWNKVFGTTGDLTSATIGTLTVSGNANLAGTTSSSFVINMDNTSSDSEDAFLAFDRGTQNSTNAPSARLTWDSASDRFNFNYPTEVQGTASASYLLTGNTLQVGGYASAAYSRFGTYATTHSNYISTTNDLLISGDLEGRGSLSFAGTASLSNTLWVSPGGYSGNVGIGTRTPNATLAVTGSGSYSGKLKLTNQGAAHTGSWPSFANTGETSLFINPAAAVADANLLTLAVNSTPKFVVDAEGDIFANNLTLTGVTTQSTTNITADLTVEGNTKLGDAQTDTIKLTGTIVPFSLTSFPILVKASASQTADLFRIKDASDNTLITVDQGTGLLTASSGFNFALGGSTATVSYSRLGTATTTHSNYISKYDDLLISGDLEVNGSAQFDSFLQVGTNTLYANPTSGNVGVGTTLPLAPLHVLGQCVTGDTRLRRRRKKRSSLKPRTTSISRGLRGRSAKRFDLDDGGYNYDEVRIDQIQPGDEILTLDEATGQLVYQKVKALMDMGVKPIYKLTTASGKTIRTTGNHPYLVRFKSNQKAPTNSQGPLMWTRGGLHPFHQVLTLICYFIHHGPGSTSSLYTTTIETPKQKKPLLQETLSVAPDEVRDIRTISVCNHYTKAINSVKKGVVNTNSVLPNEGRWTKVYQLKEGMQIAAAGTGDSGQNALWDTISKIEILPPEQVYDIEVENTHNFIGNDIVAHNTFLATGSGNVGIGTTGPGQKLEVFEGNIVVGRVDSTLASRSIGIGGTSGAMNMGSSGGGWIEFEKKANNDTQIHFITNDQGNSQARRMTINDAGNVGIGTTGPGTKLHVVANASTMRLEGTDHTYLELYPDGPTTRKGYIGFPGPTIDNIELENQITGGHIVLQPDGNGNVGIGSTTPGDALDIRIDGNADRGVLLRNADAGSSASARITLGNNSDAIDGYIQLNSSANTSHGGARSLNLVANAGDIVFLTDRVTPDPWVTIKNTGNVGIGTTGPLDGFDLTRGLNGNSRFRVRPSTTGGAGAGGAKLSGWGSNSTAVELGFVDISMTDGTAGSEAGIIALWTKPSTGAVAERMRVDAAGNVGIGTTGPIGKLQIGSNTFNGGHGVFDNSRVGVMLNGSLTSYIYASTYNDPTFPDYGLVFIHGPNTTSYNVWSISPDGPAKGDSLNFIYGAQATNIHTTTPKVVFDGNGNVGIGDSSPDALLDVESGGTTDIIINDTAGHTGTLRAWSTGINLDNKTSGGILYLGRDQTGGGAVHIGNSGGATGLYIPTAGHANVGNVGIGTTGPGSKLDVVVDDAGTNTLVYPLRVQHTTTGTAAAGIGTGVNFLAEGSDGVSYSVGSIEAVTSVNALPGAFDSYLAFQTNKTGIGTREVVRIDNSGNVGIGTTGPNRGLHVETAEGSSTPGAGISMGGGDSGNSSIEIREDAGGGTPYIDFANDPSTSDFDARIILNGDDALTIDGANVGIGVTSPGFKLDVGTGSFKAADVTRYYLTRTTTITNSDWVELGTLTPSVGAQPLSYRVTITQHSNEHQYSQEHRSYNFVSNTVDWVEVPPIHGFSWTTKRSIALEAQQGVDIYAVKLRIRNLQAHTAAGTAYIVVEVNNGVLTESSATGNGGTLATGYAASNAGWFFPVKTGAQISNSTAGLYVLDTGNVGIGTTGPSEKLVVGDDIGNITADNAIAIGSTTGFTRLILGEASNTYGLITWDRTNNDFIFDLNDAGTQRSNVLVLDSGGNVGIGTTSPSSKLTVAGDVQFGSSTTSEDVKITRNTTRQIQFTSGPTAGTGVGINIQADSGWLAPITDNTGELGKTANRWNSLRIGTADSSFAGNVGIGTTVPPKKLAVFDTGGVYNTEVIRVSANGGTTYTSLLQQGLLASTNIFISVNGDEMANFSSPAGIGELAIDFPTSTNNFAFCHETNGAASSRQTIKDCSDTPVADYQEIYPTSPGVEWGDLVVPSQTDFAVIPSRSLEGGASLSMAGSRVPLLERASRGQQPLIGVISNPVDIGDFNTIGQNNFTAADRPLPLGLSGKVKVKVNTENGPIKIGDRLTASSQPGVAMKATEAGPVVGIAIEGLETIASGSYQRILMVINSHWYGGEIAQIQSSVKTRGSTSGQIEVEPQESGPLAVTVSQSKVVITHAAGFDTLSLTAVKELIFDAPLAVFKTIRAAGDIISQGVRKTYYALTEISNSQFPIFNWEFDLQTMVSGWLTREISLAPNVDDTTRTMFTGNGAQAAEQSRVELAENGAYLTTFGVDSTRGEIQLSGSSDLVWGEAKVYFDYSFSSIISDTALIKVLVTPTTNLQGQLYVAEKTKYGFAVKLLNGSGNGKFDWLVIARRRGYEGNDASVTEFKSLNVSSSNLNITPSPAAPASEIAPLVSSSPEPVIASPSASPEPSASPIPDSDISTFKDVNILPTPTPAPETTVSPEPTAGQDILIFKSVNISAEPSPEPIVSESPAPTPTPLP